MDFRQCPACQASVLDDDAADCPFCGASMSGKPAAAPAKPAASSQPASKPAAKAPAKAAPAKRQAPPRKVGETVADDDDPFGVDTSTVVQAPKVAPKPAKGRMIRIVCPMCEKPGFISAKMQGRDVKCCNPDCMVPVFKAPAPEKVVDEDDSKGGGLSIQAMGIGAAVVAVLGGVIFWGFYASRWSSNTQDGGGQQTGGTPGTQTGVAEVEEVGSGETEPTGPAPIPLEQIKNDALAQIVTAAMIRDNDRKAYGLRLATEAYTEAGDLVGAQEQLTQLERFSTRAPYFMTEPLVLMAWQKHHAGDATGTSALVQQAVESFQQLPGLGRAELTAAIALAGAQAAFDQIPDAQATLGKLEPERERARVAALIRIVADFDSFDLDEILEYSSLDMAVDPLALAVATEIAAHGLWDKAIAWARAQRSSAAEEDCLTALAAFAARVESQSGDSGPRTQLVQQAESLSASGRTRLHAGFAAGYLMFGKRTAAEAALALAVEALAAVERPAPFATPDAKTIHDSESLPGAGLPDAAPLRSAAVAAAQVARLQLLTDQRESAWPTLLQAWEFTAGIGPNYGDILALNRELNNNKTRLEQRLTRELRLRDRDDRRQAANQYRRQLKDFDDAARKRFDMEAALLTEAAAWGFQNEVAAFRAKPGETHSAAKGQPYQQSVKQDRLSTLFTQTDELIQNGNSREAAKLLASVKDWPEDKQRRDQRAMQLACRLLKQGDVDPFFAYVAELKDPWLTEDCLEMTAALGVRVGHASDLWRRFGEYDLEATERVAFYRGLISGIMAAERQQPQPQETASVKTTESR